MPRKGAMSKKSNALTKKQKSEVNTLVKKGITRTHDNKYLHFVQNYGLGTAPLIDSGSPYVVCLSNIPSGSREDNSVMFKNLKVNLELRGSENNATQTGFNQDRLRVILIRWKDESAKSGAFQFPNSNTLFGISSTNVGQDLFTTPIREYEKERSFKVLADRKIVLTGNPDVANTNPVDTVNMLHKRKHITLNITPKKYGLQKIKYNQYSALDGHLNGLFLMVFADTPVSVTRSEPSVAVDSTLTYQDP